MSGNAPASGQAASPPPEAAGATSPASNGSSPNTSPPRDTAVASSSSSTSNVSTGAQPSPSSSGSSSSARFSPLDWMDGEKEGVLCKRGHFVKNWKNRFFVLKGKHLFYFARVPMSSAARDADKRKTTLPALQEAERLLAADADAIDDPVQGKGGEEQTTSTTQQPGGGQGSESSSDNSNSNARLAPTAYERMKRSVRSSLNIDDDRPAGVVYLRDCIVTRLSKDSVPGRPFSFEIVETKNPVAENRIFIISAPSEDSLLSWIAALTESGKGVPGTFTVSNDTFEHKIHVSMDAATKQLTGLPPEWASLLAQSGITAEQQRKNPRAVYQALAFQNKWNSAVVKESDHVVGQPMADAQNVPDLQDLINPDDPYEHYIDLEKIGKGAFGAVHAATDLSTREKVAIKKMQVTKKNLKYIVNELINHRAMGVHPNVVRFLDSYFAENRLWVVLEYMERGNLTTYTDMHETAPMAEPIIGYFTMEVLKALDFLHSHHRLHRDIKTDNILISLDGQVKLADFGFAIELTRERERRKTVIGTPYWMAPEIILNQEYGKAVDVWSLGIMVMEMCDGAPPYMDLSTAKALFIISTEGVPELQGKSWSQDLRHLLEKCLSMEVEARAPITELLQHPFFRKTCTRAEAVTWMDAALAGEAPNGEVRRPCILM